MSGSARQRGPRHKIDLDAAKLDELRRQRGWTIEDFADAAELSESTIKRAVRNSESQISFQSADKIARAFDLLISDIELRKKATSSLHFSDKFTILSDGDSHSIQNRRIFSEVELKLRFSDIYAIANDFCQFYENNGIDRDLFKVRINALFLWEAVFSSYDEIENLIKINSYRNPNLQLDAYNKAAIISIAIKKCRPISVEYLNDIESLNNSKEISNYLIINEAFAIFLSEIMISDHLGKDCVMSNEDFYEFVDCLRFSDEKTSLSIVLKRVFSS